MKKKRLDVLIVESGLAESRNQAQRMIMAGEVLVAGQPASKASDLFFETTAMELKKKSSFVSRGGEKLAAGLKGFDLTDLDGWICADIGASTGGFTDCLLQHGAAKVYAVDVGYGQMHMRLRNNKRVVMMERTNARMLESFPEELDLVTIDASFISLKILLPVAKKWATKEMHMITLVKPQFEVGRQAAARGRGVVRDEQERQAVLKEIITFATEIGLVNQSFIESPLLGPKGNKEFLAHFIAPAQKKQD